jgi:hypothetical protein
MMTSIQRDTRVMNEGVPMTVTKLNMAAGQISLESDDGRTWVKDMDEFSEKYKRQEITLRKTMADEALDEQCTKRTLSYYTDEEITVAKHRLGYINASLDKNGQWESNAKERRIQQNEYALDSGDDKKALSDRQVRRLWDRWKANGQNLLSLIPHWKARGNREHRLTDGQEDLIAEVIEKEYMN